MLDTLALIIVLLVGVYFLALGTVSLAAPARAARFLNAFAGSGRAHYLELAARALAGLGFVLHAPHMQFPLAFEIFGWVLLVTTAGLLAVPWQWHHRFARRTVPWVVRRLSLVAAISLLLGVTILVSVVRGDAD